jgi:pyruvate dehydrogenase E2 component (dihydrolipoamide acetyltransferase)
MSTAIVMPSFGMYTAEGTLVRWLRPDGARVEQGEPVLEIETEKAINEVIAPQAGILRHVAEVGDHLKEEGLLGYVLAEGEEMPSAAPSSTGSSAASAPVAVPSATAAEGRVKASPVARKLATQHGLDLASIEGSGPGGRIVEADVLARVTRAQETATAPVPRAEGDVSGAAHLPFTSMRRAIGEKLRRGLNEAVPLTITRDVEADAFVAAREDLCRALGTRVPWDALFIKLLAAALQARPELNGVVEDGGLKIPGSIDIGFAVALADGLVVPVVRHADVAPLSDVVASIRQLTQRAHDRRLRSEDVAGAVSTVSNLGAWGIDSFTPVLNPPQSSILGVGRVARRPVVRGDAVAVANTCSLCLTFDHRVTDGAPAARLLDEIARRMNDVAYLASLPGPGNRT